MKTPTKQIIFDLEARYNVILPEMFNEHLLESSLIKGRYFHDDDFVSWWKASEIKNIPDEYEYDILDPLIAEIASKSLFFCDFSIWVCACAVSCSPDDSYGKIILIDGENDSFVANNLEEFIQQNIYEYNIL